MQVQKKEYKYTIDGRVRFSEIDHTRKITVPSIINYFQDCSTFQSEELGNGVNDMYSKGKVWVLAYWQIEINKLPVLGEAITTQTWAHAFKGFQGERNYRMLDAKYWSR